MIKTGNIAADSVYAAMRHYKNFGRTVKTVNLSKSYWGIFLVFIREEKPELEISDEGIQFNNVLIRKGHSFMKQNLECELNALIPVHERQ